MNFDAFISHASEDKEMVARPLAKELKSLGYSVWFDEFSLKLGDSLSRSINRGLADSRYGIVIISIPFLKKQWTNYELGGLIARENLHGEKVILPIWHKITPEHIKEMALPLLDKIAATTDGGISNAIAKIIDVLGEPLHRAPDTSEENAIKRQQINKEVAKHTYTIELYNEWHSDKMREARIFVSAWTKEQFEKNSAIPSLTKIENEGGTVEYHVFAIIHFFEKWALLSKNEVIDKGLLINLLSSYLVWYETNIIDPLLIADERNQDFKNLLKLIKREVFTTTV